METSTVITSDDERIEINQKFVPGLVAGAVIYWCDDHEAYHPCDDYDEEVATQIVRAAAGCNDMPAWNEGQPLDPRSFQQ